MNLYLDEATVRVGEVYWLPELGKVAVVEVTGTAAWVVPLHRKERVIKGRKNGKDFEKPIQSFGHSFAVSNRLERDMLVDPAAFTDDERTSLEATMRRPDTVGVRRKSEAIRTKDDFDARMAAHSAEVLQRADEGRKQRVKRKLL